MSTYSISPLGYCIWTEQEQGSYWSTSCRKDFSLIEGTPFENEMHFCPFCGKSIAQHSEDTYTVHPFEKDR